MGPLCTEAEPHRSHKGFAAGPHFPWLFRDVTQRLLGPEDRQWGARHHLTDWLNLSLFTNLSLAYSHSNFL